MKKTRNRSAVPAPQKNRNAKTQPAEHKEKEAAKSPLLSSKIFLYLTEFFAGMSVMAVELGASRLIAPYFGSSQTVWTIIIGTIMIAMALGNLYGGKKADKDPNPDKLYIRILIAAVWIAAIPVVGKYIIIGISALLLTTVNSNFLIWVSFIICFIIFVFPLFLLGTVTPSLVKYTVSSLDDSGKTVGKMNAANTIGSIIGTFAPTFITIPAVGTFITFLIFSGILLTLSIVYFVCMKRKLFKVGVAGVLVILCCVLGSGTSYAISDKDALYEGESIYNYIQIEENDSYIKYSSSVIATGVESIYYKSGDLTGSYYDYALAANLMSGIHEKENADILIIGMGAGTYAKQCLAFFDNATVTGVEVDKKVIGISRKYFDLPESVYVAEYDGRAYLNVDKQKYDVIMVDVYRGYVMPYNMTTVEFFSQVKEHLKDGGVMVLNICGFVDMEGGLVEYLSNTVASAFAGEGTQNVYRYDMHGNYLVFASESSDIIEVMQKNTLLEENSDVLSVMQKFSSEVYKWEAGTNIITDDMSCKAETLSMSGIDVYVKKLLEYYRYVYDTQGLDGLAKTVSGT